MTPPKLSLDDAYDDFGFSVIGAEEIKDAEHALQQTVSALSADVARANQQTAAAKAKLAQIYKMIMPLLLNLKQNPEKEYILWPNRVEKIDQFISKLDALISA